MSAEATGTLTVTHYYAASAERVFDAFLDVALARRFLFATATGEMVTAEAKAKADPQIETFDRYRISRRSRWQPTRQPFR